MQDTKYDMAFKEEPSLKGNEPAETEEAVVSAGAVDESMLSEEEKKQVEEYIKKIDIK